MDVIYPQLWESQDNIRNSIKGGGFLLFRLFNASHLSSQRYGMVGSPNFLRYKTLPQRCQQLLHIPPTVAFPIFSRPNGESFFVCLAGSPTLSRGMWPITNFVPWSSINASSLRTDHHYICWRIIIDVKFWQDEANVYMRDRWPPHVSCINHFGSREWANSQRALERIAAKKFRQLDEMILWCMRKWKKAKLRRWNSNVQINIKLKLRALESENTLTWWRMVGKLFCSVWPTFSRSKRPRLIELGFSSFVRCRFIALFGIQLEYTETLCVCASSSGALCVYTSKSQPC